MAIALTLEELLGPSLREAREEIAATFKTHEELRSHRLEALNLPKVQEFRLSFEDYLERSEHLAGQLAGDHGVITSAFQQKNTEVRHAWQVSAVCYHPGHNVPKVVAIASIPTEETEEFASPQEAIRQRRFTYADLTHSYHSERIDEQGRIICRQHGAPATLEVSAKVHRIVPKPRLPPGTIEGKIVEELANMFYPNGSSHNSGKHERILKEVRLNLEVLLRAGESGIYRSIYDALEQTRHRAVTAPHIAKNADLDRLSETFKELIGYDAEARTKTPEQLAQLFRTKLLFEAVKELAREYIPSPLVVTVQRTKGQSLIDKVTVAEHHRQLLEASKSGELQAYFRQLRRLSTGMLGEVKEKPPSLDDVVGVQALVHGDRLDYDPFDLRGGIPKLSEGEIQEAKGKCYHVLAVVANIPPEKKGYARMEPERTANGNGNRQRRKQRTPPDPKRPMFVGLDPVRGNGLVVDLTPSPSGRFDDYIVQPRGTGYMAIHLPVGSTNPDLEGAVVEVQIRPNFIDNFEKLSLNGHEARELERAAQISFLLATGRMSPMEWELNKLLLTPSGKTYVEPGIMAPNGKSRAYANPRRLTAAAAGTK